MDERNPNVRENIKRTTIFRINPNKPEKANKIIVDYFSELDEITAAKFMAVAYNAKSKSRDSELGTHILSYRYLLGIILLALITSVLCFIQDYFIQSLQKLHVLISSTHSVILNLFIWIIFSTSLCLTSSFISSYIPKTAEESEIAELKAVISGLKIPNFFELKTLALKFITVILLIGGGISMSKEGALVHIAGIVSYKLMKTKYFNSIFRNVTRRNQFLSISFSAGLASVFNSSIGAMIFSIEISSSYYVVSNMWRAAFCTLLCSIFTKLLRLSGIVEGINSAHFDRVGTSVDLFLFGFLGFLCGVLAYIFILMSQFLVFHRLHRTVPLIHSRYRYIIFVSVITSFLTFWTTYVEVPDISVLNHMFNKHLKSPAWGANLIPLGLLFYILIKLAVTALATSLEAPVGVIFPLFACGSVIGRLFGLLADYIRLNEFSNIYAAVGAASFVSAATHSISVPILIFSMTGEIHYLVPMMFAVFIAYSTSNALTISFYDRMLALKRITYMPLLQSPEMYDLTASNLTTTSFPCFSVDGTLSDMIDAMFMCGKYMIKIPIINREGTLVYEVKVTRAKKYLRKCYEAIIDSVDRTSRDCILQMLIDVEMIGSEDQYRNVINRRYSQFMNDFGEVRKFLSTPVDLESEVLKVDDAPFSIVHTTVFAKIQYMFLMLGLSQVYVTEKGILVGVIVRDSFIKTALRHNYSFY